MDACSKPMSRMSRNPRVTSVPVLAPRRSMTALVNQRRAERDRLDLGHGHVFAPQKGGRAFTHRSREVGRRGEAFQRRFLARRLHFPAHDLEGFVEKRLRRGLPWTVTRIRPSSVARNLVGRSSVNRAKLALRVREESATAKLMLPILS